MEDPKIRNEMFSLRKKGRSIKSLALKYRVSEPTIRTWCITFNIRPPEPPALVVPLVEPEPQPEKPLILKEYKYDSLFKEPVNEGKDYKDYLKLAK